MSRPSGASACRAAYAHAGRFAPGSALVATDSAGYHRMVPRYEFRCRACASVGGTAVFEVTRPMSAADEPASCPEGHDDTVKLLSTVAMTGRASAARAPSGGGCCGGACGCG